MTCLPGYLSQIEISPDNGATYDTLISLVDASLSGSTDELQCTTHATTGSRSWVPGLRGDTMSVEMRYDKEDKAQRSIINANRPRPSAYKIRYIMEQETGADVFEADAFSTSDEISTPLDDISSFSVDLRISNANLVSVL